MKTIAMQDCWGWWSTTSADLLMAGDEVHIWQITLDQPDLMVQSFSQVLSENEWERAQRFHCEQDRRRFIAGRGQLRSILGRYLDFEPDRLQFCYGPKGKPALGRHLDLHGNTLHFNLSHSNGLALCALAWNWEVGVDLEYIRPVPTAEQLAQRFFSSREHALIKALPAHDQPRAFFRLWTFKEAYLKATGKGLTHLLRDVEVTLAEGKPARLVGVAQDAQVSDHWSLQSFTPTTNYLAALAVKGHDWRLNYRQWPAEFTGAGASTA
jgi:4'-phosphopantetheinyl transferase